MDGKETTTIPRIALPNEEVIIRLLQLISLNEESAELEKKLAEEKIKNENLASEMSKIKIEIVSFNEQKAKLEEQVQQTKKQGRDELKKNIKSFEEKINDLQKELDTAKQERDDAVLKAAQIEEQLQKTNQEKDEALSEVAKVKDELESANGKIASMKAEIQEQNEAARRSGSAFLKLQEEVDALQKKFEAMEQDKDTIANELLTEIENKTKLQKRIESLENELKSAQQLEPKPVEAKKVEISPFSNEITMIAQEQLSIEQVDLMTKVGINLSELNLLRLVIETRDGITRKELQTKLKLSQSRVSEMVTDFSGKGLLAQPPEMENKRNARLTPVIENIKREFGSLMETGLLPFFPNASVAKAESKQENTAETAESALAENLRIAREVIHKIQNTEAKILTCEQLAQELKTTTEAIKKAMAEYKKSGESPKIAIEANPGGTEMYCLLG